MLEFIKFSNPQFTHSILNEFDPATTTWIVSDLKSKTEIQKKIIDRQGYFLESSILRVSDFWKTWLRRLAPEMQIVSVDFLKSMVEAFIEIYGKELKLDQSEATTLFSYLTELAPILLTPNSEKVLQEWFELSSEGQNRNKDKKWYKWFLLSKLLLKYLIVENKVIESRWIAAFLQSLDLTKIYWSFDLIVDLGTEMTAIEMSLFQSLSKKVNVKILTPNPIWKKQFPYMLKTYDDREGYGKVSVVNTPISDTTQKSFVRVSTQLAEVKNAVALVRKWCDQGISPNQISIISPDIEYYWPCLQFYLHQEGLPLQKDQVVNLASLNVFQMLTSYLKNINTDIQWESLESTIFSNQSKNSFTFENFKSLFYLIIDDNDLKRDERIYQLFYRKVDFNQNASRDEFFSFLTKVWLTADLIVYDKEGELFKTLFKDLVSHCSNMTMKLSFWFKYLQQRIKNKEIKTVKGNKDGLQIVSLMSAHLINSSYQVWIGLDEKMLSNNKKMILPLNDAIDLKKDFDFSVQLPDESLFDFNIRWQSEKPAIEKIYLCAHTAFDSTPLTSSLFFIENVKNNEIQDPQSIRFDELQSDLSYKVFEESSNVEKFTPVINEVLNRTYASNSIQFKEVTATEIEDYWLCPFKLLARKGFRLRELPFVGLDLDPRQKGTFSHQLFEYLTSELNQKKQLAREDILIQLDCIRDSLGIFKFEPEIWSLQKKRFLQIAEKFIDFESTRINLKNIAVEKEFKIYFDLQDRKFTTEEKDIAIKGRIDRIDEFVPLQPKKVIIFDYKSSTSDLSNYKNFLKKGELQLLLYAVACELILFPESEVIATLYYDSRLFKTNKGFMDSSVAPNLYQGRRIPSQVLISNEQRMTLYKEFFDVIFDILNGIKQQNFTPKPNDIETCKTCDWKKICRAPHLMY